MSPRGCRADGPPRRARARHSFMWHCARTLLSRAPIALQQVGLEAWLGFCPTLPPLWLGCSLSVPLWGHASVAHGPRVVRSRCASACPRSAAAAPARCGTTRPGCPWSCAFPVGVGLHALGFCGDSVGFGVFIWRRHRSCFLGGGRTEVPPNDDLHMFVDGASALVLWSPFALRSVCRPLPVTSRSARTSWIHMVGDRSPNGFPERSKGFQGRRRTFKRRCATFLDLPRVSRGFPGPSNNIQSSSSTSQAHSKGVLRLSWSHQDIARASAGVPGPTKGVRRRPENPPRPPNCFYAPAKSLTGSSKGCPRLPTGVQQRPENLQTFPRASKDFRPATASGGLPRAARHQAPTFQIANRVSGRVSRGGISCISSIEHGRLLKPKLHGLPRGLRRLDGPRRPKQPRQPRILRRLWWLAAARGPRRPDRLRRHGPRRLVGPRFAAASRLAAMGLGAAPRFPATSRLAATSDHSARMTSTHLKHTMRRAEFASAYAWPQCLPDWGIEFADV